MVLFLDIAAIFVPYIVINSMRIATALLLVHVQVKVHVQISKGIHSCQRIGEAFAPSAEVYAFFVCVFALETFLAI